MSTHLPLRVAKLPARLGNTHTTHTRTHRGQSKQLFVFTLKKGFSDRRAETVSLAALPSILSDNLYCVLLERVSHSEEEMAHVNTFLLI